MVAIALARITGSQLAKVAGVTAAVISVLQFCLGMWLTATSSPATAHVLYQMVNRMDGVKMLALAASGVVYLLLLQNLALLAGPALVLLLVFITGGGIWLGRGVRGR